MTDAYDRLKQQAADLQTSVDAAQARSAAAQAALQAIIDAGAANTTDEQLQAVIDTLKNTQGDVDAG